MGLNTIFSSHFWVLVLWYKTSMKQTRKESVKFYILQQKFETTKWYFSSNWFNQFDFYCSCEEKFDEKDMKSQNKEFRLHEKVKVLCWLRRCCWVVNHFVLDGGFCHFIFHTFLRSFERFLINFHRWKSLKETENSRKLFLIK